MDKKISHDKEDIKNKLLLSLGSLSIFSAIPFVAAKCDNTETKDNNSSKEPGTTDPGRGKEISFRHSCIWCPSATS
ncbi:variable surface lipoprotein [Mycoplasmopsis bovis]|uniref:variable surface lipoprotein n=1 Tax=Mycoplasmopsis bovis TaxID=28903 RepID=UPI003D2C887C